MSSHTPQADAQMPPSPRWNSRRALLTLGAIVAVAAFLRFYQLDRQCIWLDEAVSVKSARLMDNEGIAVVATRDNVAPLTTWLLSQISDPGRETGTLVRLPAACAGVISVVLIYALGVVLLESATIGLAAAAIAAISPFAIWYAQDGRMYSLLMMFSALAVLFFWPIARGDGNWKHALGLTITTALGVYTHQYIALISAACGLYLLMRVGLRDKRFWVWMGCQVVAALSFVPWLIASTRNSGLTAGTSKGQMLFWLPYTFMAEVFGFSFGPSVNDLRSPALGALREDLIWLLPALAGAAWITGIGAARLWKSGQGGARFCFVWIAVPILLAMVAPLLTSRVNYNVRYVIGMYPALALVLGAGLLAARRSKLAAVAAGLMLAGMALGLVNWYTNPRYAKEEIRGAVALLKSELKPGDVLILSSHTAGEVLDVYGLPLPERTLTVASASGDTAVPHSVGQTIATLDAEPAHGRVWLLEYRIWESDPKHRLRAWLDEHGPAKLSREWPGVVLRRYE